ncbi:MAG: polysaccharide biosynthesis/export family protein [Bacteroidetes bacterium]|nr:polysaccharide biosynthesis/export family protein [Bacteroidota bacterium]
MKPVPKTGLLLLILCTQACIQHKTLVNFNEGPAFADQNIQAPPPLRLKPDDLIAVSIQTLDPVASAPFNAGIPATNAGNNNAGGANANTGSQNTQPGYLIDPNGYINLPLLGKIQAAGLSTAQLRDTIYAKANSRYLNEPIVNVRLLNFRFTVLGEVTHAGNFSFNGERLNVLEALGMAGDVTIYGNREDILIIRETNGQRLYGHLNLHQRDLFLSPFWYLQQNDLLYIAPTKNKIGATADQGTKILQWTFPIVTTISVLINLFR